MYDFTPTDEQKKFLRWVRGKGEFFGRMVVEAYYREISGRPVKDFQLIKDRLDALEREALIECVRTENGATEYRLTPRGIKLLDE